MMTLRQWRKAQGLLIEDVVKKTGISKSSVSRIELGDQWPGPEEVIAIRKMTGGLVTAVDLLLKVEERIKERAMLARKTVRRT